MKIFVSSLAYPVCHHPLNFVPTSSTDPGVLPWGDHTLSQAYNEHIYCVYCHASLYVTIHFGCASLNFCVGSRRRLLAGQQERHCRDHCHYSSSTHTRSDSEKDLAKWRKCTGVHSGRRACLVVMSRKIQRLRHMSACRKTKNSTKARQRCGLRFYGLCELFSLARVSTVKGPPNPRTLGGVCLIVCSSVLSLPALASQVTAAEPHHAQEDRKFKKACSSERVTGRCRCTGQWRQAAH